eukprot:GFUD01020366.1.p1 GENE.GFUD01020366.1~~GFUD01020366.1.p1  ORF type:complete len:286 (+),score=94.93 GFUD01020366.1:55-912(+)
MASGAPTTEAQDAYEQFWPKVSEEIRTMSIADLKHQELPLARIKKIMKLDEDVKMISAEAPVLFAKATEMFIHELTMRAWIHTEDNKRRTLQRNDIAMAITKYDQFDFLIDIVPRDDIKPVTTKREDSSVRMVPDQVSYYFQLAQQHQQALQTSTAPSQQPPQQAPQQVVQAGASGGVQTITVNSQQPPQPQVIQLQPQQMTSVAPPLGGIQIVQQIVGPGGEIQQIPIQLNQQQLQMIRAQMIGGDAQPIVIQTAPIQAQVSSSPQTQQTIQLQGGQQVFIQQE